MLSTVSVKLALLVPLEDDTFSQSVAVLLTFHEPALVLTVRVLLPPLAAKSILLGVTVRVVISSPSHPARVINSIVKTIKTFFMEIKV